MNRSKNMDAIEGDAFAYGYLKLTHLLRQEYGLIINKKKVYRLCKELDVLKQQRKLKLKHPRKLARNRVITAPCLCDLINMLSRGKEGMCDSTSLAIEGGIRLESRLRTSE